MRIKTVRPGSPLSGKVLPGSRLVSINGHTIRDHLDFIYRLADDYLSLNIEDQTGRKRRFRLENSGNLGLDFAPDTIMKCRNKCIFCFIHQQPKGLRRSLYVKDDDYRLSFTHGNFISLSNLSETDISRIVEQRLSPLYISVHATDEKLRNCLFGRRCLPPIMPLLKSLGERGIKFHTQIVVCPGINDGSHLEHSLYDLFSLYPAVMTLGIVPVGLTRYRRGLYQLKPVNRLQAGKLLDFIHARQNDFCKETGTRFIFAADELYILAGRRLPRLSEYEEMEQFENGVGMMRHFLSDFNRKKRYMKSFGRLNGSRIALLTGLGAFPIMKSALSPVTDQLDYRIDIIPVKNNFWGRYVTVSGLLTGRDLLRAARRIDKDYDMILLPPNCLNDDQLFLDDMSLTRFRAKLSVDVRVGQYSLVDTLREVAR